MDAKRVLDNVTKQRQCDFVARWLSRDDTCMSQAPPANTTLSIAIVDTTVPLFPYVLFDGKFLRRALVGVSANTGPVEEDIFSYQSAFHVLLRETFDVENAVFNNAEILGYAMLRGDSSGHLIQVVLYVALHRPAATLPVTRQQYTVSLSVQVSVPLDVQASAMWAKKDLEPPMSMPLPHYPFRRFACDATCTPWQSPEMAIFLRENPSFYSQLFTPDDLFAWFKRANPDTPGIGTYLYHGLNGRLPNRYRLDGMS